MKSVGRVPGQGFRLLLVYLAERLKVIYWKKGPKLPLWQLTNEST